MVSSKTDNLFLELHQHLALDCILFLCPHGLKTTFFFNKLTSLSWSSSVFKLYNTCVALAVKLFVLLLAKGAGEYYVSLWAQSCSLGGDLMLVRVQFCRENVALY
jgi:hypothetical protein